MQHDIVSSLIELTDYYLRILFNITVQTLQSGLRYSKGNVS